MSGLNYTKAVFLISDDVRAINVSYEPAQPTSHNPDVKPKMYTFKTVDKSIKVGDLVVVPTDTRHKMTVCRVEETDLEVDVEDDSVKLKWIIDKVNTKEHEKTLKLEQDCISQIRSANKAKKREELREALLKNMGEDNAKALPLYNTKD